MNAETKIKKKLLNNLGIKSVSVINNSYLHQKHRQSPKNGNSHFKIIIKDTDFNKISKIESHKKIYSCLSGEMKDYIHALEIEITNS
ncbi:MAG: BolA family transcriptional regulator [Candidatus Pelagibacter sp.]|nr:BolA family transcriptional regulator [Candidatus Pelagibacter sp.]|tara:strand:- start:50 stop:310 length:261 start_codon:yes stop_codon:yes gene_type:complete